MKALCLKEVCLLIPNYL